MSEVELIEIVRENEILRNPVHSQYHNKQEREVIWDSVQKKIGPISGKFL